MRVYPLHYLNEYEFESLSTQICNKILGVGTIPFAQGKDGGRDGRFHGKANCFPSVSKPWEGNIVIQAKHTTKENSSCSDSTFSTILKNEIIPAILNLKQSNLIDYYLLYTNRKLTGIKDGEIEKLILSETGITNVVIANEKIQSFIQEYSDIVRTLKLNDLLKPLEFDEADLKEVIIALHIVLREKNNLSQPVDFTLLDLSKKNILNKLSQSYFDDVIRKDFEHFNQINIFLASPINALLKDLYDDTVSELNAKITLRRDEYVEFENLLDEFYNYVVTNNNEQLKGKKRLVRTLLNYMYCNCDIGKK